MEGPLRGFAVVVIILVSLVLAYQALMLGAEVLSALAVVITAITGLTTVLLRKPSKKD